MGVTKHISLHFFYTELSSKSTEAHKQKEAKAKRSVIVQQFGLNKLQFDRFDLTAGIITVNMSLYELTLCH